MTFCLMSHSGNGRPCAQTLLINTWKRHQCVIYYQEEEYRTKTLYRTEEQVPSQSFVVPHQHHTWVLHKQSQLLLYQTANGRESTLRLTAERSKHAIFVYEFVLSTASMNLHFRATSSPTSKRQWSGNLSASTRPTLS